MLIKTTWTLTVSEPTILPRSYNLELVKKLHQQLDIEIGNKKIPSTSYSGFLGFYSTNKDFFNFYPEEFYKLSLSGLNESSAKAISSLQLSELEFLGAKFNVINREDKITSYEELYTNLVANEPQPIRKFELKFLTPTAFSQGKTALPLPIPTSMFRSWLERWNHFAPVYLGSDDLLAYLNDAILFKHHKIQTRSWQLQKGYLSGFVGDVTLQIFQRADDLLANVAHLLVNYAEFSGTGMKTRLGMGQTLLQDVN